MASGSNKGSSSSASTWRSPSAANQAKYNLVPLPEDFEPTEEEEHLLKMYETIRTYERQAARLKEQKAREKLAAKEAEFQQSLAPKRKKHRRKKDKPDAKATASNDEAESSDYDESDVSEEVEDPQSREARKAATLEALREEVEGAKQAASAEEAKEKELRERLLATNEDVDLGPALKKKKREENPEGQKTLLTSMMKMKTPPHEFSESLGLKAWKGKVLFPTTPEETKWTPPESAINPNQGAFLVELDNFDITKAQQGTGNNTIAVKFNAPAESKRFSINIAGPGHDEFNSVLFHFNPRSMERGGQLVINDKQEGTWGQAIALPLSQVPLIFGQPSVTLIIQINGDGFDIFIEDQHCARLEHRKELPSEPCSLWLQFPSSDDYGSPENWIVYKAWWGNKPSMAKGDVSGVAGVNSYNSLHPRKLFVSGLPRIQTEAEVDLRRAELERAFRKYGGDRGVTTIIPTNTTFAFVEMETERMADLALAEMSDKYRISRARRSRHEALQEERAAKEAEKQGIKKENNEGW